jgi:hypothetical protein
MLLRWIKIHGVSTEHNSIIFVVGAYFSDRSNVQMKIVCSFERSGSTIPATQCYIPEELKPRLNCRRNPKSLLQSVPLFMSMFIQNERKCSLAFRILIMKQSVNIQHLNIHAQICKCQSLKQCN